MWILEQIWKRNYFTCLENFYFFLNKAIDFQTNEVWSVVITSHRQCQKLPCFRKYCSLQGGACFVWQSHMIITLIQDCFEDLQRTTQGPHMVWSRMYCQALLHTMDENELHISCSYGVQTFQGITFLSGFLYISHNPPITWFHSSVRIISNFFQVWFFFNVYCLLIEK